MSRWRRPSVPESELAVEDRLNASVQSREERSGLDKDDVGPAEDGLDGEEDDLLDDDDEDDEDDEDAADLGSGPQAP